MKPQVNHHATVLKRYKAVSCGCPLIRRGAGNRVAAQAAPGRHLPSPDCRCQGGNR
jgi:hypothetical protein